MSKKSFFIGFASGIVLTLVALFVIGVIIQNYETNGRRGNSPWITPRTTNQIS